jgi:hypothetical protein
MPLGAPLADKPRIVLCGYVSNVQHTEKAHRRCLIHVKDPSAIFRFSIFKHLVTNNRVIETCSNIRLIPVGGKEISAYIVAKDETNDLVILKTSISPTIVSVFRTQVRVGESVFGFGLSSANSV